MMEELAKQAEQLFEVAPAEIEVCLRVNGPSGRYELAHRLRPPALPDWCAYERELKSAVEVAEGEPDALHFVSSPVEAAGVLYDRLYLGAGGYRPANAFCTIAAEQIPIHHKEMVVRALTEVVPASARPEAEMAAAEPALFALDAGQVEVQLEATRQGVAFRNLVHVFGAPSAADRVEYSRVTSQALYCRTSHRLRTILPSRLPGLVALYDRLIEAVRGYAAAGAPLADRAAIVRQMDPLHKKVAVQLLFGD